MAEQRKINGSLALNTASRVITIPAAEQEGPQRLRVAAYCRVSSDSADQLNSFAAQNAYYTALITRNPDWELVDIYADRGISGTSADKREDFQRLLADCKRGRIDKILVKSISRFARNTKDCLKATRELKEIGVGVCFEEQNIDSSRVSGEMMTAIFAALAQKEMTATTPKIIIIPPKQEDVQAQAAKKHLRVAAYCRVSTDDEEQLTSYEAQRTYYTEKITQNPEWTMASVFADEGITGTSVKSRKEFQKMIRQCRQGRIDLILTKSLSRFSRNTLDVIKYTRELRNLGVSVIFEKENINSIYPESEFLITLYGAFAQSESESISTNVSWGKRQAMKEGRAIIQYKRLLGYVKGENGKPKIVPDQAETIRFIYDRYLAGDTLRALKARLEADGVPYITGEATWNISGLQSILQNEKYCGDVLLQKTFIQDCISKKVIKNTGQLPKVLIQNHHEGIVSREMFDAVQAETARRRAVAASTKKSTPTGLGKYSGKHALTSLLVCGECGTPYRRVVWTQNGNKRPVWRCVNRLDYGRRICKHSPTLDEKPLQQAILSAINSLMRRKEELLDEVSDALAQELTPFSGDVMSLGDIDRAIENLSKQFDQLMQETGGEENLMDNMERFQNITSQLAALKERRNRVLNLRAENSQMTWRLQRAAAVMREAPAEVTEWDEHLIHQLVEEVKVMSADKLLIRFRNGVVVEQTLGSQEAAA